MDLRDRQVVWRRSESFTVVLLWSSHQTSLLISFCTNLSTFTNTHSSRIPNVNIWNELISLMRASFPLRLLADKRLSNVGKIQRACLFLHKSVLPRLRTSCGSILLQVFFFQTLFNQTRSPHFYLVWSDARTFLKELFYT